MNLTSNIIIVPLNESPRKSYHFYYNSIVLVYLMVNYISTYQMVFTDMTI